MTPAQQSALEALVGRQLAVEDLAAIEPHLVGRNDVAIAEVLSAGRMRIGTVSTPAFASWAAATGMRAAVEDIAMTQGHALRSSALALRDVLMGGAPGIRMDYPANQQMLAAWVQAGALAQADHDSLIALATVDDPITQPAVSAALNAAEGA